MKNSLLSGQQNIVPKLKLNEVFKEKIAKICNNLGDLSDRSFISEKSVKSDTTVLSNIMNEKYKQDFKVHHHLRKEVKQKIFRPIV